MTFDGKAFGQEVVTAVKAHLKTALTPVLARLDALEKRLDEAPVPKGVDEAAIIARVSKNMSDELGALRHDLDALTPQVEAIGGAIGEEIASHVAKSLDDIPPPISEEAIDALIRDRVAAQMAEIRSLVEAIPDPIPAPELPDIAAMIDEAVAALPAPQDGKSVTVEELRPVIDECVSAAVSALPAAKDGRDGLDVKDLFRAEGGRLVSVMSDGTTKDLGVFVGKDGSPGEKGADGRDGTDGKNGRDGFGFDDLDLVETDDGVMLRFMRGEQIKEFRLPVVIDRGVYDTEKAYRKGDGTTWGGCFWIAQKDNPEGKPDSGNGWRLAVKKGRDGRNGEMKADKPVKVKV